MAEAAGAVTPDPGQALIDNDTENEVDGISLCQEPDNTDKQEDGVPKQSMETLFHGFAYAGMDPILRLYPATDMSHFVSTLKH